MLTPEQQKKVEQAISLLQSVQKNWVGGGDLHTLVVKTNKKGGRNMK